MLNYGVHELQVSFLQLAVSRRTTYRWVIHFSIRLRMLSLWVNCVAMGLIVVAEIKLRVIFSFLSTLRFIFKLYDSLTIDF